MAKCTDIRAALRQYVEEQIPATERMIGRRMWDAEAIGHIALLLVDYLENAASDDEETADTSDLEGEARRNRR